MANPSVGPLSHTTSSAYHVTSHMGKVTEFDYDANFRRKRMTVGLNTDDVATTTFTYDEVGNQETVTEPNGQPGQPFQGAHSTSRYDDHNRRISLTDALDHTTAWQYDNAGNMTRETRADTKFRTWDVYDAMNRVKQTTGFLGTQEVTRYDYDYAGNLTRMTDANGGIYETVYDTLNRKESLSYPHDTATQQSQSEVWRYDIAGNLLWYKNTAFQYKHFVHDNRNRQTRSYWNSSPTSAIVEPAVGVETITTFDAASRVTSVLSGSTAVAYGYDEANRKVWEDQTLNGFTRRVETLPDDDGNRFTLTVAGAYSLTYDYTPRQQLSHINKTGAGGGQYFEYTYDKSGNLKKREDMLQGHDSTIFVYDKGNRVTLCVQTGRNAATGQDDQPFARSDYDDFDPVNNLKSITREEEGWKGERFVYDYANQLSSVSYKADIGPRAPEQPDPLPGQLAAVGEVAKDSTREALAVLVADPDREPLAEEAARPAAPIGPRTVTYNNDSINRKGMSDNGVTTYTPNNLNQYTFVSGHDTPVYDTNFNLRVYEGWTYTYDADKRLVSATNPMDAPSHSAQFVYDGLGRCVQRTIDTVTTVFTYDEWKPVAEWTAAGGFVAWNIYGPGADEILVRYQQDPIGYVHYHLDAMDNVQFLLGVTNLGLEKYTYDVFGQPTITGWNGDTRPISLYGNRFMFTGREYLYTLGLYDYRHRLYHPGLGRFLQTCILISAGRKAQSQISVFDGRLRGWSSK